MKRTFKKLLVPVSFRERTTAIFSYARRIAEVTQGEVTLVHAVPTQSYRLMSSVYRPEESGGANEEFAAKVTREKLEQLAHDHLGNVPAKFVVTIAPNPAKVILDLQQSDPPDLVLIGKSQAGELGARLQGGLVEKLIRSSACPVWCVSELERFARQESVRDVLAPIALDRGASTLARLARSVAEPQGGKVTLLHVVPTDLATIRLDRGVYGFKPDEQVSLARAQKGAEVKLRELAAEELTGVAHEEVVVAGQDRAGAILEEEASRTPSLIAMGTPGYTGFFQVVLGSVAETVARRASCSVMTIRIRE